MSMDEIVAYLKTNLKIQVTGYSHGSIEVELILDEEVISTDTTEIGSWVRPY